MATIQHIMLVVVIMKTFGKRESFYGHQSTLNTSCSEDEKV